MVTVKIICLTIHLIYSFFRLLIKSYQLKVLIILANEKTLAIFGQRGREKHR